MLRYYFILSFFALGIDQLSKWIVVNYMKLGDSIPILPDVFHLTSHRNKGAAFGILQNQRVFFLVFTTIVIIGMAIFLRRVHQEKKFLSYGLACVIGGASGNFVDRAFRGEVVDMFDFQWINYPIFNIADIFIVIGVIIIMLATIMGSRMEGS
ncbi:signal peptidase II [Paenibacillus sp. 1P07SE]|uniref:signal peptidase II n=1 Tax=Paenibacillus sp. 1P07SE TaxID=3132209 RepID=UPI0039A61F0D